MPKNVSVRHCGSFDSPQGSMRRRIGCEDEPECCRQIKMVGNRSNVSKYFIWKHCAENNATVESASIGSCDGDSVQGSTAAIGPAKGFLFSCCNSCGPMTKTGCLDVTESRTSFEEYSDDVGRPCVSPFFYWLPTRCAPDSVASVNSVGLREFQTQAIFASNPPLGIEDNSPQRGSMPLSCKLGECGEPEPYSEWRKNQVNRPTRRRGSDVFADFDYLDDMAMDKQLDPRDISTPATYSPTNMSPNEQKIVAPSLMKNYARPDDTNYISTEFEGGAEWVLAMGSSTAEKPVNGSTDASLCTENTRRVKGGNKPIVILLIVVNFLLYSERGVIAGASVEVAQLVQRCIETSTPNMYVGLLHSVFIVGLSIASPIYGHLVLTVSPFKLLSASVLAWTLALLVQYTAAALNSYGALVFGRIIVGAGLAGFVSLSFPVLAEIATPSRKGLILAVFLCMLPIGQALGICISASLASTRLQWYSTYVLLSALGMLCVIPLFALQKRYNILAQGKSVPTNEPQRTKQTTSPTSVGGLNDTTCVDRSELFVDSDRIDENARDRHDEQILKTQIDDNRGAIDTGNDCRCKGLRRCCPWLSRQRNNNSMPSRSFTTELKKILSHGSFICMTATLAVYSGILQTVCTFSPNVVLSLQIFQTEVTAATVIGVSATFAGLIGTLCGGRIVDMLVSQAKTESSNNTKYNSPRNCATRETRCISVMGTAPRDDESFTEVANGWHRQHSPENSNLEETNVDLHAAPPKVENTDETKHVDTDNQVVIDGKVIPADEGEEATRIKSLSSVCRLISVVAAISMVILCSASFSKNGMAFLILEILGTCVLTATQVATSLSILLSVPAGVKFFASATSIFLMHIFGDVPAPFIFGWIKDSMAPACAVIDDDDARRQECILQANGVRLSLFTLFSMLIVMVLAPLLVICFNRKKLSNSSADKLEDGLPVTGEENACDGEKEKDTSAVTDGATCERKLASLEILASNDVDIAV